MPTTASFNKPRLLVLVGPTAVGKTQLSLSVAKHYECEIISGDSMQVYRKMDIGTAKLPIQERGGIPHHMMDIHDPDEAFSVAEFQERGRTLIQQITARNHLPFIVGGTGLYVESLCYGFVFGDSSSDEEFRQQMADYAASHGSEALHERLKAVDPITAERLHHNDQRRVIRALEVFHLSGEPLSSQLARQKRESPYDLCMIGLTMDRQMLYKRIEARIDIMLEEGLIDEVRQLLEQGYSRNLVSMQGLGYKEIAAYLEGEMSLDAAVGLLKRDTRRYAKRQLSWFRRMTELEWVDVTDSERTDEHFTQICKIIAGKFR
ncbi:tRNA (adenosine(37)-N6)-dimethylallyltransferase MiaA [Paenibacillus apiarius]|uniref:tRNA dimethylallyltransferase n=1 Tax=Paenibacillus apiarius TaxID=46240 RepID=A0ABT4DTX2_9BACL|nr:tRNA (adenosine(37)-N6)-dimethylallyltransferase MiaA [Paenibacillus apiarius]MCY9515883.1 tRNA (adenosine(37)-N6)-dimethylallyltransferase MiaA [Paenibacillus apiarius]MCY9520793.1 tRNA (adenosine(37)-N6)-dimethylallyltransferase MiaA [Paenibacillus apiarius]MCY9553497.1 tRNA (adenosine(37)-N6)-dimethylallyltransferase MiaA [Paenibacillus apiarius]MCY9557979.1 tRNA (adenosine(37)-N6)-dimethylallyltransferase MiaA [Paenibacillus apiarius]MCY9685834.1 tRNA (adenosine(37)-N6)-dimethylallyltra